MKNGDDNINHKLAQAIAECVATGDWFYMGKNRPSIDRKSYNTDDIDTDSEASDDYTEEEWDRGYVIGDTLGATNNNLAIGSSTYHWFTTTKPVTIREVNPSAGVNTAYKVGHIMVGINQHGHVNTAEIVGDCVHNGYNAHPHLSNGSICWGTGYDPMDTNARKAEYGMAIGLGHLKNLMETYCPDAPYVSMATLIEVDERIHDRMEHMFSAGYLAKLPAIFTPPWLEEPKKVMKEEYDKLARYYDEEVSKGYTDAYYNEGTAFEVLRNKARDLAENLGEAYALNELPDNEDELFNRMEVDGHILPYEDFRKLHRVNFGDLFNRDYHPTSRIQKTRAYVNIMGRYYSKFHNYNVKMFKNAFNRSTYPEMGGNDELCTVTDLRDIRSLTDIMMTINPGGSYYVHKCKMIIIEEVENEQVTV
jgi:hypothetical protein